jgi:hypothetical protein
MNKEREKERKIENEHEEEGRSSIICFTFFGYKAI